MKSSGIYVIIPKLTIERSTELKTPKEIYNRRKKYYDRLIQRQTSSINFISNLRLFVFLLGITASILFYLSMVYMLCIGAFLLFAAVFFVLMNIHNKIIENKELARSLFNSNTDALKRIDGDWHEFHDCGDDFKDDKHPYSDDLDIFGKGSLFQYINTAVTFTGRNLLANLLAKSDNKLDAIIKRQDAIKELSALVGWRQRLHAYGISKQSPNPDSLFSWSNIRQPFYLKKTVLFASYILPGITICLILLAAFSPNITYQLPLLAMAGQYLILKYKAKSRNEALNTISGYNSNIQSYWRMLKHFEKHHFNSHYLLTLKKKLISSDGKSAHLQVERLSYILNDLISNRHNSIYAIINVITLWDYHCMIALENWKNKSGHLIKEWIDVIGELEALSSLSIVSFDHPNWIFPTIKDAANSDNMIAAKAMGHPLLPDSRVYNDLHIGEANKALLITGSNMSGKSTLLRTSGINLVLAYSGASVCAEAFTCSIMELYTCMRIRDDLENSISSFYAEILRVKMIVEAAKTKKNIFFLLDEIFKGTNSQDRHMGAKLLIKQLLDCKTIGLISTHDLELGDLEQESHGNIKNYHFREYYENDKIHFDYKLHPGISTTRNAMYLMKMAGIDIKEETI